MSKPNSIQQQFRHGVKWSALGTIGAVALQLLQSIVFARVAGAEAVGAYALVMAITAFLSPFAEAGLGQAVVQAPALDGRQIATLGWINFLLGVVLFGLCWWVAPVLTTWYGQPEVAPLLRLMAATLLFTPVGAQYGGLLVRHIWFDWAARIEWWSGGVGMVVLCLLLWKGWGAWAMTWSYVARTVLSCGLAAWYGRRLFSIPWWQPAPLAQAWHWIKMGAYDLAARWADVGTHQLDKLLVGKWLGAVALAHYNQAYALYLIPISRLSAMVAKVVFPMTAQLQHQLTEVQTFFDQAARQLLWLLMPLYGLMALFSGEIIEVLYGPAWLPASPLLAILSVGGMVKSALVLLPQVMRGMGTPQRQFWLLVGTVLGIQAVLVVFLCQWPTAQSAAIGRLVVIVGVETGLAAYFAQQCGLTMAPIYRTGTRLLLPLLAVVGIAWWVSGLIHSAWMVHVAIKGMVAAAGGYALWRIIGRKT